MSELPPEPEETPEEEQEPDQDITRWHMGA